MSSIDRPRPVLLALLLVGCFVLIATWTSGYVGAAFVGGFLALVLLISRAVWLPVDHGNTRVRLASLSVAVAAAGSLGWWTPYVGWLVVEFIAPHLPTRAANSLVAIVHASEAPQAAVLLFLLGVIWLVNRRSLDRTAMGAAHSQVDTAFPERDYKDKARSFCLALEAHHTVLDQQTQWSPAQFVPLEAEVEATDTAYAKRTVTPLIEALRQDKRTRLFLVTGDPGSGKSIALRRLAFMLLKEFESTGRIPLYVNLKEWRVESNQISPGELLSFVRQSVLSQSDVFGTKFIEHYFDRLFEHGRLFLILDSFDEIPIVLDSSESSDVIGALSDCLTKLFSGATGVRGVVSSRLFKRPTIPRDVGRVLEIRPFSDRQISQLLTFSFKIGPAAVQHLFRDRPDLAVLARNPFCAELIKVFLEENDQRLPSGQTELFDHHLQKQLQRAQSRLDSQHMSVEDVIENASEIAHAMYTSRHGGLDVPLRHVISLQDQPHLARTASILSYARLGRYDNQSTAFSFVHRRFHEYLVARPSAKHSRAFSFSAIPEDSRWRDALVVYCETATPESARTIANLCWSEIQRYAYSGDLSATGRIRVVHCLRFLRDAFYTRRDAIAHFQKDLAEFVEARVGDGDILEAKLAVEVAGVLDDSGIEAVLLRALKRQDFWISDTAIRSCRHLPAASLELEVALFSEIERIPWWIFRRERRELAFALSLSDGFGRIYDYVRLRSAWVILFPWALVFVVLSIPFFAVMAAVPLIVLSQIRRRDSLLRDAPSDFALLVLGLGALMSAAPIAASDRLAVVESVLGRPPFSPDSPSATALAQLLPSVSVPSWMTTIGELLRLRPRWEQGSLHQAWAVALLFAGAWVGMRWPALAFRVRSRSPRALAKLGLLVLSLPILTRLMTVVVEALPTWLAIIGASASILAVSYVAVSGLAVSAMGHAHDWRHLRRIVPEPIGTRLQIAERFTSLRTVWGRRRYVAALAIRGLRPEGRWPGERIPSMGCAASSELAQLEERWQGLSR